MNLKKVSFLGFSLIELLTVIAILAILSAIALIQYNKYKVNSVYSEFASQLDRAKSWAESVIYIANTFPNGVCNSTNASSGSVKCMYYPNSDTIGINPSGDLIIDVPFIAIFQRNDTARDENGLPCGWIIITCPNGGCGGLKNHDGSGPPKICVNTCTSTEEIHEDTNLHGVVNGGCP